MATIQSVEPFDTPTSYSSPTCCSRDYVLSKQGLLRLSIIVSFKEQSLASMSYILARKIQLND